MGFLDMTRPLLKCIERERGEKGGIAVSMAEIKKRAKMVRYLELRGMPFRHFLAPPPPQSI